jgi:lauroyl/myristoyl acyltransferase
MTQEAGCLDDMARAEHPCISSIKARNASFKLVAAWVGFYFLRLCERMLPTNLLSLLLRFPSTGWGLMQVRPRELLEYWRRFPESWRPKPGRFFLWQSLGRYRAQPLYVWPDRLCKTRWLNRCRLEGRSDLIRPGRGDRAVVLASLHFGPFETLPYWLRAHGIVTTMIRGPIPDSLGRLTSYQHSLSPPSDVPVFRFVSELAPLPTFSRIDQLLSPGRHVLVTVDVNRGIQFCVPFEDRLFRMATGAIRLAAMADAELIPCLICDTGSWRFAIHFGDPVPGAYLRDPPDLQAAGTHLLEEFSKVITRYPAQCRPRLLSALSHLPKSDAAELSALAHAPEGH